MTKLVFVFVFFFFTAEAQLQFSEKQINLGTINEAYEIKGAIIIKNTSAKKIFLMRADADRGLRVYTSRKTLIPDDTCLLLISFIPETGGRFSKKISLIASDQETPYELNLSGNLTNLKTNDKTACYYFGNKRTSAAASKEMPAVVIDPNQKRDNTNKIPDHTATQISDSTLFKNNHPEVQINAAELSSNYKPNNILFLVDVSGSMRDSLKLPVMKKALHTLINAVRAVDRITFVTYADSITVLREGVNGDDKKTLHNITDALKAKGLTKGNRAILFSQKLAQKHFIAGGNNQIFLATDGKFKFYDDDFKIWQQNQLDQKILLTAVAFGNDREAMKNLKDIAKKGEGSFIHVKKRVGNDQKLLEEIKGRSKIH